MIISLDSLLDQHTFCKLLNHSQKYPYLVNKPIRRTQLLTKHGSSYTPPDVGGSTGFNDVPVTAYAAAWIKELNVEGIAIGCGGGNYCPDA
jgi:hypothetical protein